MDKKLTCLIVDDEPLARLRLQTQLARIAGVEILGEAEHGEQALQLINQLSPNLVLLDIQMPGVTGIELARHLQNLTTTPAIIFCTAYDEYALEAFRVAAVDYLLKPVNQQDLEQALDRAAQLNQAQQQMLSDLPQRRTHISAKTHLGIQLVALDQVRLLLADQKYVSLFYGQAEPLLLDESLKQLEEEFPDQFVRVHRNALVAKRYIQGLEKMTDGGHGVRLKDFPELVTVSRRQFSEVKSLVQAL